MKELWQSLRLSKRVEAGLPDIMDRKVQRALIAGFQVAHKIKAGIMVPTTTSRAFGSGQSLHWGSEP